MASNTTPTVFLTWNDIARDARANPSRYGRFQGISDEWTRLAYRAVAPRHWIGGRGYHRIERIQAWPRSWGETAEQAADHAGAGNPFCWMGSIESFARTTRAPEGLPPLPLLTARGLLTAQPGTERVCCFLKRTTGELRRMRFRYDPERPSRSGLDAEARDLLPVYDLDKQAPRLINLRGVRTVEGRHEPSSAPDSGSRPPVRHERGDAATTHKRASA